MSYFYEQLFCYRCNFTYLKTGFDSVNEKDQIFIKLTTDWSTYNYNGKESKFRFVRKYKTNNPNREVYYVAFPQ